MIGERELLVGELEAAFAGIRLEGGTTLHEALAHDDHADADALAAARAEDADVPWTEVPDVEIEFNPGIFSFLDFNGFRYYLAAYMRWAVRHFDVSDSASSDYVIYALDPRGPLWAQKLAYFECFSDPQRRVIAKFLRFMSSRTNDADTCAVSEALNNYWAKVGADHG
jgi:hypothetical protein